MTDGEGTSSGDETSASSNAGYRKRGTSPSILISRTSEKDLRKLEGRGTGFHAWCQCTLSVIAAEAATATDAAEAEGPCWIHLKRDQKSIEGRSQRFGSRLLSSPV